MIKAKIENVGSSVAFAIHVQAIRSSDGERILPALMNDNYFTLLKGESKDIEVDIKSMNNANLIGTGIAALS